MLRNHNGPPPFLLGASIFPATLPVLLLIGCGSVRSQLAENPGAQASEQLSHLVAIEPTLPFEVDATSPATTLDGRVLRVAGGNRDCDAEQIECFNKCWNRKPPYPYQRGKADHYQYCNTKCLKEYMRCLKSQGASALQFPAMQDAQDWLKRHQEDILAGTVVVVAGAAMVIVVAETGGLALVPLLAL